MSDNFSSDISSTEPGPSETTQNNSPGDTVPKILCIEGRSSLREVLAYLLHLGSNYQIDVASNGLEGVQKARAWEPDLILTGLRLPVMDGFEAIKVIRSNPITTGIPIIVISAWGDAKSKQRALNAGANEHLTPPVDIHRLLRRIEWYLNQKHPTG